MFDNLTLLDLHFYIKRMEKNIEERSKKYSNSKLLATQLYMLKQVLNSMQL